MDIMVLLGWFGSRANSLNVLTSEQGIFEVHCMFSCYFLNIIIAAYASLQPEYTNTVGIAFAN